MKQITIVTTTKYNKGDVVLMDGAIWLAKSVRKYGPKVGDMPQEYKVVLEEAGGVV